MQKVIIRWEFFRRGGGCGAYTAADDELARTPEPSNPPTPLLASHVKDININREQLKLDPKTVLFVQYYS